MAILLTVKSIYNIAVQYLINHSIVLKLYVKILNKTIKLESYVVLQPIVLSNSSDQKSSLELLD